MTCDFCHDDQFPADLVDGKLMCVRCKELEQIWQQQRGVDPVTGKGWLTPRMEHDAAQLAKIWEAEQDEAQRRADEKRKA